MEDYRYHPSTGKISNSLILQVIELSKYSQNLQDHNKFPCLEWNAFLKKYRSTKLDH